jgi:hypothetical protein
MDSAAWNRIPFAQQMGHITSEIARARVWEEKKSPDSREQALLRAVDLIDLSLQLARGSRCRELARLREVVSDCLIQSGVYRVSLLDLERYGLGFLGF